MKGIGYAISAGALAVAAFTVSPWWAIGAAVFGLLGAWSVYRERQRKAWLARVRANRGSTLLLGAPADLPPGKYNATAEIDQDGRTVLHFKGGASDG